jgi:hypothetical protein
VRVRQKMVELSIGDITCDLACPLAAEIDKPKSLTNEKTHIACERYAIESKLVLNTNRNPW